jgi:hypothetical protein
MRLFFSDFDHTNPQSRPSHTVSTSSPPSAKATDQEAMSTNGNANVPTETSRLVSGGQGEQPKRSRHEDWLHYQVGVMCGVGGAIAAIALLISSKFFEGSEMGSQVYQIESLPIS